VASGSIDLLRNPSHALALARSAAGMAVSLGRVTALLPDSRTIFKGELSVARRTAWSRPLPLDAVKAVGRATGTTVNDVIVAAVAGALRRYLQAKGQRVDGLVMRAMVPVNIRTTEEALEKLGNHFGLFALDLPVSLAEPVERLRALKRNMDALKQSPEALVTYSIVQTMGMTPVDVERLILRFFTSKTSIVLTNVAGPRHKLYLAANPIRQVNFWVPQTAGIGLGISIFSYAGEVVVAVMTNARVVPDPETLVEAIHAEFDALCALTARPEAELEPVIEAERLSGTASTAAVERS
jgi:WS/DGAT/MGAT family acyltransferase